jgi:ABC-2 type transport system ATP-binding protein
MIDHGSAVLHGPLSEIKARYKGNSVVLECDGELGEVPGVAETRVHKGRVELVLAGGTTPQQILEHLVGRGIMIERFEVATPTLRDIFLQTVGRSDE